MSPFSFLVFNESQGAHLINLICKDRTASTQLCTCWLSSHSRVEFVSRHTSLWKAPMHHYDVAGRLLNFTALHTTLTFGTTDIYDLIRKYLSSWKSIWSPCFRKDCLEAISTSLSILNLSEIMPGWGIRGDHEGEWEFKFFLRVRLKFYLTTKRIFFWCAFLLFDTLVPLLGLFLQKHWWNCSEIWAKGTGHHKLATVRNERQPKYHTIRALVNRISPINTIVDNEASRGGRRGWGGKRQRFKESLEDGSVSKY